MSTEKHTHGLDIMLDTVDLRIQHPAFTVLTPGLFSPPLEIKRADEIPRNYDMNKLYKKYTQNTPTLERKTGAANIALTAYRRFKDNQLQYDLHIRASLPKLLFGENLHEVRQRHLGRVAAKLHDRLLRMGIATTEQAICAAIITKVDFCKNIALPFPLTVREVLSELYKADMGERMQVNMRDYLDNGGIREYREHGESLHFHTTSRQVVFYDKLADIEKDRGASIDKNKMPKEREMRELLSSQKQVLRIEARFNDQRAVRRFMSSVVSDLREKPITFEMLFNDELCRNALLHVWKDITSRPGNQLAFKTEITPEDALNHFITREAGKKSNVHSLNRTLNSFAIQQLVHHMGANKARKKLQKVWSTKTCGTRLDAKIRDAALCLQDLPPSQIIGIVDSELDSFTPYGIDGVLGPELGHPGAV